MRFLILLAEADHFAKWEAADPAQRERVVADFQAFDDAVELARLLPREYAVEVRETVDVHVG